MLRRLARHASTFPAPPVCLVTQTCTATFCAVDCLPSRRSIAQARLSRLDSSSKMSTQASASALYGDHPCPPRIDTFPDAIHVKGLTVRMLVGVDNWERVKPQPVVIDAKVHTDVSQAGQSDHLPHSIHYGILTKELEAHCQSERYRSLEALAEGLAKVCIFVCKAPRVTLQVNKPRALLHADSAGVQVIRTAHDFVTSLGQNAAEELEVNAKDYTAPSKSIMASLRLSPTSQWATHDRVVVKNLYISTILGVNPWERVDKQIVRINLEIFAGLERLRQAALLGGQHVATPAPPVDVVTRPQNYRTIVRSITRYVEQTNYKTVESLATSIAAVALGENRVERIRVSVDKPSAIMFADAAGVEVDRDRQWFGVQMDAPLPTVQQGNDSGLSRAAQSKAKSVPVPNSSLEQSLAAKARIGSLQSTASSDESWHVAAIALGSNIGDRFANIERAVQLLSENMDCKLVDTSFLYETEPKYVLDQPRFVNGACRISTRLSPSDLLALCQSIEKQIGRSKQGVPVKGPRAIDLDILFYDRQEINTPDLVIPHPAIAEREFVLMPLIDILPDYLHPCSSRTVSQLHSILVNSEGHVPEDMRRVLPVLGWQWRSRTYVMGIINATPDSFSDGGDNAIASRAVDTAAKMVADGADILDVGGMSTAPHAAEISAADEIARVVPIIQAIRAASITTPISIDTFRASVAQAALDAGANVINDVSAGARDPTIFDVARRRACPIILMHMRGDSKTMNGLARYEENDVVAGVRRELEQRVEAALRAGIRRWNIILDPGIGFAKDQAGNLQLLQRLSRLQEPSIAAGGRSRRNSSPSPPSPAPVSTTDPSLEAVAPNASLTSFPLLLGASRKRFLGTITGRTDAKERMPATAAACTAGIMAGVDMIRVHDVKEMVDVAKTADAIVRAY